MSKRVTTAKIKKMKKLQEKITMLTAYDYPTAKLIDESGVDIILVGDSLGMVMLGYEDTTKVTMDDMLHHIKAVTRAVTTTMVVGDMPFLSYHVSLEQSIKNAGRIIQEGHAQAVKLEGGKEVVDTVKAITRASIPVMGHIGLTPQSIHQFGGYFIQGKNDKEAKRLIEDAIALEEAGVFALVLECVPTEVAKEITNKISIPTIGIGAGNNCDGQVLVTHDLLGLHQGKIPKFAKQYNNLSDQIKQNLKDYSNDVKGSTFPEEQHSFHMEKQSIDKMY